MTATRLPRRSTLLSQRAVCSVVPANSATPSMSGGLGTVSTPLPLIRNRAVTVPALVCTRQRSAASSYSAPVTSVPNRIRSRSPYLSTQCSAYALSSWPLA